MVGHGYPLNHPQNHVWGVGLVPWGVSGGTPPWSWAREAMAIGVQGVQTPFSWFWVVFDGFGGVFHGFGGVLYMFLGVLGGYS